MSGGLFTPDQSFINLSKKGILTFYPYWCVCACAVRRSEECVKLVEDELCWDEKKIELPIFTSCPLFKKRLQDCVEGVIHTCARRSGVRRRQAQKTIDLVRQLLSMELNFINIHHPDFIGTHIEKVRVEATAEVRKALLTKKATQTPSYDLPVCENWLWARGEGLTRRDKRNKFHKYQRRYAQIQNRILWCVRW